MADPPPPRLGIGGRYTREAVIGGVLVALVATAMLVVLGMRRALGYDDFWHVFIARQEDWGSFWSEVTHNAHPPFFYLLLKGAISTLGGSLLAYRAVSTAAIAVSAVLIARLGARITGNATLSVVGAAAFSMSPCILKVGTDVRAYAVLLAVLLTALSGYFEWLGARPGCAAPGARALFAGALSLALVTHYSSFFFLGATVLTPAVLYVSHPRWRVRLRREVGGHPLAVAAMFGVPVVVALALYVVHVRAWANRLVHVPRHLYDPGAESPLAFVVRTTENLVLLFLPHFGNRSLGVAIPVILLFAALTWLMVRRRVRGHLALALVPLLLSMILANIAAAFGKRYPYGGELRHEVYLFPFVILCVFAGLERLRCSVPARWSSRRLWAAAVGLAVGASIPLGMSRMRIDTSVVPFGGAWMGHFRKEIGTPPAILVDGFNFIALFAQHHEWRWYLRWQEPRERGWQVWEVSRNGVAFQICRNSDWQLNMAEPEVYRDVRECMERTAAHRVGVFRPQQHRFSPAWAIQETSALAERLGREAGVAPEAVIVNRNDVYASFRLATAATGITVIEATYGGNCRAPSGNATRLLRAQCEGQPACTFRVDSREIGDPAPGCAKDFVATWACAGEQGVRLATVKPEAGYGSLAILSCDHHLDVN